MWAYYGSKSKLVNHYPAPLEGTIIESFAGTARYALKYWDRKVILRDCYHKIIGIWKYLQQASIKDIEALPDLINKGDTIPNYLCDEEKWLLGFAIDPGSAHPKQRVSSWGARDQDVIRHKKRIISNLHKIRHWDIELGDYSSIPNQKATWFIDPPYQHIGKHYDNHKLNYKKLGDWCRTREGQVIVCEGGKSSWLPFKFFKKFRGSFNTRNELIFYSVYGKEQELG